MRRILTISVLAVLLASCSGAGKTTTPGPATTQAAATGNIDASFEVGGHELHLRCEGTSPSGSPTLVYRHALLAAAKVPEPYLLVGFSFRGLLDVPVTYLAARPVELPPNWPVKKMQAFIAAKQAQFTTAVPNGRLVEVQSSHDIDLEQPALVVKEINRVLETA